MKNIIIAIFGWGFITTGFLGLFLPIVQGVLFIVIGLYLLSIGSPKVHKQLHLAYVAFKTRFPHFARMLEKMEKRWEDLIQRWRSH